MYLVGPGRSLGGALGRAAYLTPFAVTGGAVVARPRLPAGFPSGDGTTLANGYRFTPTRKLLVTGVVYNGAISDFNDAHDFGTRTLVVRIMDATTGAVLAHGQGKTTGPVIKDYAVTLKRAVTLKPGVTYLAVYDIFTIPDGFAASAFTQIAGTVGTTNPGTDPGLAVDTAFTFQAAPITMVGGNGGVVITTSPGSTQRSRVASITWADFFAAGPLPGVGTVTVDHINLSLGGTPLGCVGLIGFAK